MGKINKRVGLGPTKERAAKGTFVDTGRTADGRIVAMKATDSLTDLRRRGTITEVQLRAGLEFREDFERLEAALAVPAADWTRLRVDGGSGAHAHLPRSAGQGAWDVLSGIGGLHSLGGACLVRIAAEGMSLSEFARTGGAGGSPLSVHAVKGALLVALDVATVVYGVRVDRTGT
jgi:hypothetical protein